MAYILTYNAQILQWHLLIKGMGKLQCAVNEI